MAAGVAVATLLFLQALVGHFRVPLLPDIARDLGLAAGGIGMMTAGFALGRLVTDLPAGRLFDRLSRSTMMALGCAIMAVGSIALSTVHGIAGLVAGSVVLGVGSSIAVTTAMGHFSEAAPARRGMAMAVFSAALLGGQAIGPAVSGVLSDLSGWRVTFTVGAVAMVVLIPVARRVLPAARGFGGGRAQRAGELDLSVYSERTLRHARLVLLAVPLAVMFTLGGVAQTTVPLIGGEDLGLSASTIGLVVGIGGVTRIAGTFIGGRLADRIGRRATLVPGVLLQGVGVLLLAFRPTIIGWTAAVMVMGISSYGIAVGAAALRDLAPAGQVGRSVGQFRFSGDLGLLLGPLVTSVAYQLTGPMLAALIPGLLLLIVAGLVQLLVPGRHRPVVG